MMLGMQQMTESMIMQQEMKQWDLLLLMGFHMNKLCYQVKENDVVLKWLIIQFWIFVFCCFWESFCGCCVHITLICMNHAHKGLHTHSISIKYTSKLIGISTLYAWFMHISFLLGILCVEKKGKIHLIIIYFNSN